MGRVDWGGDDVGWGGFVILRLCGKLWPLSGSDQCEFHYGYVSKQEYAKHGFGVPFGLSGRDPSPNKLTRGAKRPIFDIVVVGTHFLRVCFLWWSG